MCTINMYILENLCPDMEPEFDVCTCTPILNELEHRQVGWKVLILKYDLGKSLGKEMWCKMADTKTHLLHILKHEKWGNMR